MPNAEKNAALVIADNEDSRSSSPSLLDANSIALGIISSALGGSLRSEVSGETF
jgi:hypothetical protein